MGNLLDLLTRLKSQGVKKTVSPLVEYTHRKDRTSRRNIYRVALSVVIFGIIGGTVAVYLLQQRVQPSMKLTSVQTERTAEIKHGASVENKITVRRDSVTEGEKGLKVDSPSVKQQRDRGLTFVKPEKDSVKKKIEENQTEKALNDKNKKETKKTRKDDTQLRESFNNTDRDRVRNQKREFFHLMYRVNRFEQEGRVQEAIELLSKAIKTVPDDIRLLNKAASLYIKIGRCDLATEYITEVLQRDSDYVKALINLAVCQQKEGEIQKAEQTLLNALEKAPYDGLVNYNLAVLYERQKDYSKARRYYTVVIEYGDGSLRPLAVFRLAEIERLRGNKKTAYELYRSLQNSESTPESLRRQASRQARRLELLLRQ